MHTNMRNVWCLVLLIVIQAIIAGSEKISPKLDFEGDSETVQVKKEIKNGKIKGLRVTVDTSELKESKSSGSDSSSSSESSEKKKTVGVRTDVTFEITSGETNDTKTVDEKEIGKDDDNASIPIVPVFKGKPDRGGTKDPKKSPNFNDVWSVKPLHDPAQPIEPNYHHFYDVRNRYGGGDNGWQPPPQSRPQYEIWTTERYNNRKQHDQPVYHHRGQPDIYRRPPSNFIPYHIHRDRFEPCNCKEYPGPSINHRPPSSDEYHHNQKVDDKLEKPFSRTS